MDGAVNSTSNSKPGNLLSRLPWWASSAELALSVGWILAARCYQSYGCFRQAQRSMTFPGIMLARPGASLRDVWQYADPASVLFAHRLHRLAASAASTIKRQNQLPAGKSHRWPRLAGVRAPDGEAFRRKGYSITETGGQRAQTANRSHPAQGRKSIWWAVQHCVR